MSAKITSPLPDKQAGGITNSDKSESVSRADGIDRESSATNNIENNASIRQRTPKKPKRTKTFTGCWTCRARKVKCDTTKPFCNRCLKSKLTCEGYDIKLRWSKPINFDTSGTQVMDEEMNMSSSGADGYFQRRNIDFVRYPKSMIYQTYEDIDSDLTFLNNNSSALSTMDQSEKKGPFTVFIGDQVTKESSSRSNSNKKNGKQAKRNHNDSNKIQSSNNANTEKKRKLTSEANSASTAIATKKVNSPARSTKSTASSHTTSATSSPSSSTIICSSSTTSSQRKLPPPGSGSASILSNGNNRKSSSNTQIIIGNQHPLHKDNPKYVYPVLPVVGNLVNPITKQPNAATTANNNSASLPLSLSLSSPSMNSMVSSSSASNTNTTSSTSVKTPNLSTMPSNNNNYYYYNSMVSSNSNSNATANKFQNYSSSLGMNMNMPVNTTPPIFSALPSSTSNSHNNNNYHERGGLAANDPSATSLFSKLSNAHGNSSHENHSHTHVTHTQQPPPISMVMMQGFSNTSNTSNTSNLHSSHNNNGNGENNSFSFTENFGFDYYPTAANATTTVANPSGSATITHKNTNSSSNSRTNSSSIDAVVVASEAVAAAEQAAVSSNENNPNEGNENYDNDEVDDIPPFSFGEYNNSNNSINNTHHQSSNMINRGNDSNAENDAAAGMVMMNSNSTSNSNIVNATHSNDSNHDSENVGLFGSYADNNANSNNSGYSYSATQNFHGRHNNLGGYFYNNSSSGFNGINNRSTFYYPTVYSNINSNTSKALKFHAFINSDKNLSSTSASSLKHIPPSYSLTSSSFLSSLESQVIPTAVTKFLILHFVDTIADLLTVIPSNIDNTSALTSSISNSNPWKMDGNMGYLSCAIRAIGSHALFGNIDSLTTKINPVDDCILNTVLSFSATHLRNQSLVEKEQQLKDRKIKNDIDYGNGEEHDENEGNKDGRDGTKYWEDVAFETRKNALQCFKKIFFTSEKKKSSVNDDFFMSLMGLVFLDTVNGMMVSCRRVLTFMESTLKLSSNSHNVSPKLIKEFEFLNCVSKSTQITTNFKKFHNSTNELDSVTNNATSSDIKLRSEQSLINLFKNQKEVLVFLKIKYGTKSQKQNFINELKHIIDYYNSDIIYNLDKFIKNDDLFNSVYLTEINSSDSHLNDEIFDVESFDTLPTSLSSSNKLIPPPILGHHHYLDSGATIRINNSQDDFEKKLKFTYKEYFVEDNLFNENGIFGLPNSLKNIFANVVELFQVKINLINTVYVDIQPYKDKNRYITPQDTKKLNDITRLISEFKDAVVSLESKINSWELEWVLKDPFNEYNFKTKLHENVYHHTMSFKFGILIYFYRNIGPPPNSARPISDADINYYISKCLDHLFSISLDNNNRDNRNSSKSISASNKIQSQNSHSFLDHGKSTNYHLEKRHSVLPLMWQVFISACEIDPDDFLLSSKITRWFKKISVYCNDHAKLFSIVERIWKFRKAQKVHFDDLDKCLTISWLQFVREYEIDLMVM